MYDDPQLQYDDQQAYNVPTHYDNSLPPDLNAQIDEIVNQKVEMKMEIALQNMMEEIE